MNHALRSFAGALALCLSSIAFAQTTEVPAPALRGTTLSGKPYSLEQAKGKVTLVSFWATWCPTCRAEMPTFRKFYDANRSKGFELVTVSIDDDMKDVEDYGKLASWMTTQGEQFPKLWRKDKSYQDNFGRIIGTPSSYWLDRQGRVIGSFRGALKPADYEKISAAIKAQS
jgi:cytochrome c biogenesis protein CcmG, thiol:disulfide interchange protein DsbE